MLLTYWHCNPFEKFERKRFIYYAKDLAMQAFNPDLWEKMDDSYKNEIVEKEEKFLEEYYQKI
ncbi:MAG: hypothetical protein VZT48_09235 [Bulleidia sp.]|nr:hypothetical protein [Bulleidia sp.]